MHVVKLFQLLKLTLDISYLFAEVGHLRIAICVLFSLPKMLMDIGLVEMTSLFILFSGSGVLNYVLRCQEVGMPFECCTVSELQSQSLLLALPNSQTTSSCEY